MSFTAQVVGPRETHIERGSRVVVGDETSTLTSTFWILCFTDKWTSAQRAGTFGFTRLVGFTPPITAALTGFEPKLGSTIYGRVSKWPIGKTLLPEYPLGTAIMLKCLLIASGNLVANGLHGPTDRYYRAFRTQVQKQPGCLALGIRTTFQSANYSLYDKLCGDVGMSLIGGFEFDLSGSWIVRIYPAFPSWHISKAELMK
ncbi:hypothetical protein BDN72DRAFT_858914 [Pluteus cervinus]|uniref:Uncharacterized protein n=1 Tax=Pluteus cervinus TaxID=181527 RepID=A0ACD3AQZ5_9AGAR|nr:hypothetical protein BDN72DRAFT_858914 [Pluteus cervinus]